LTITTVATSPAGNYTQQVTAADTTDGGATVNSNARTLVINRRLTDVSVTAPNAPYDGAPYNDLTFSAAGIGYGGDGNLCTQNLAGGNAGGSCSVTYTGTESCLTVGYGPSPIAPTNAGSYSVSVTYTNASGNYFNDTTVANFSITRPAQAFADTLDPIPNMKYGDPDYDTSLVSTNFNQRIWWYTNNLSVCSIESVLDASNTPVPLANGIVNGFPGVSKARVRINGAGTCTVIANQNNCLNGAGGVPQIAGNGLFAQNYVPIATTTSFVIDPALPLIEWGPHNDITAGTALTAGAGILGSPNPAPPQLDAVAYFNLRGTNTVVPGAYTYYPPAGTVLSAGKNQVLSVEFVPTSATNFIRPRAGYSYLNVNGAAAVAPGFCDTYHYASTPPRTVSIDTTATNTTATCTNCFLMTDVGAYISGNGIPANTSIVTFNTSSSVVLSAPATASNLGVSATIVPINAGSKVLPNRTFAAVLTDTVATITSAGPPWADFTGTVGMTITGSGIPANTTITAATPTTATLSNAPTATRSSTVTVGGTRTFPATTSNASITVTSSASGFLSTDVGTIIAGNGISAGTTITAVANPTSVTISQAATLSATSSITVGGDGPMRGMVAADFNGDTFVDLVVANAVSLTYYQGKDDGTFYPPRLIQRDPANWDLYEMVTGTFDAGTTNDFAVTNAKGNQVIVCTSNGAAVPVFTCNAYATGGTSPRGIGVANFDGVNGPDLVVSNYGSDTVALLLNNGAGAFPAVSSTYALNANDRPWGVVPVGYNASTHYDVAVALNGTSALVAILQVNGAGNAFVANSRVGINVNGPNPRTLAAVNLDGPNGTDLLVGNYGNPLNTPTGSIWQIFNPGNFNWAPSTPRSFVAAVVRPSSIVAGDIAGDGGAPDFAVVSNSADTLYLFKGASTGANNYTATPFNNNSTGRKTTGLSPYTVVLAQFELGGRLELVANGATELTSFRPDVIPTATISSVKVGANPAVTPPFGPISLLGDTATITVTLSGTGPFVVKWSDGTTQNTSLTTLTRNVKPSLSTVYTIESVTGGSACGGTVVAPGSVTIQP
ncbi:MAG TPA: hypothetical protein VF701_17155, partial [Thermoanaerobaculia bacterium]